MSRFLRIRQSLRSSLWFVPGMIVVGAVLLALALIEVDIRLDREYLASGYPRLFGAGAEGARAMLSAIASSMITVAGVAFSITVVVLALASAQYTSRILRNFMSDRANQTVLGVFVGVYAYCLVALRSIRGADERLFVPQVTVLAGVALAFVGIAFFIYFIHHIAASIQATSVIAAAAHETIDAIDRNFPPEGPEPPRGPAVSADIPDSWSWTAIPAGQTGFIQGVDLDAVAHLATQHATRIRMDQRVGEFVVEGSSLVSTLRDDLEKSFDAAVNAAFSIGRFRTVHQDVAFGIGQIVDVALKALSPGINDTTTAVNCVDYLGAILARLATRELGTHDCHDESGTRVFGTGRSFADFVSDSFDPVRQNASGNVPVLGRLLAMIGVIGDRTADSERLDILRRQVALMSETAERTVPSPHDLEILNAAARDALRRLSHVQESAFVPANS